MLSLAAGSQRDNRRSGSGVRRRALIRSMPLRCKIIVFLEAKPNQLDSWRQRLRQAALDPDHQILARRYLLSVSELGQRGVDVLVVEPIDDLASNQQVEDSQRNDETGRRIHMPTGGHQQSVVVAVPRKVGALSELRPVLFLAPVRTTVQVTGAKAVAAFETDRLGWGHESELSPTAATDAGGVGCEIAWRRRPCPRHSSEPPVTCTHEPVA